MKQMILEIIDSYESRIRIVNDIIEGSQELIDNYRRERESTSHELRDNLAHSESLRKKDFDKMMTRIYSRHDERERELKAMLHRYVQEHQDMATKLRSLLENPGEYGQIDEQERLAEFRSTFEQVRKEQKEREKEVREILAKYEYEQSDYFEVMNSLLNKGRDIRLPDVKRALQDFSFG